MIMNFLTHKFEMVSAGEESFLFRRPGFHHNVESDIKARCIWYYGACRKGLLLRSLFLDGAFTVVLVRAVEKLSSSAVTRWVARLTAWFLKVFCHVVMGCGASFGPGLVLLHPFGVFIHKTVKAGENLVMQNSITLGGEEDQGPRIGNNVFIGVGARVIGPVGLGDRCRIGANAVVMSPVNADHVAAGNPARQIPIEKG